MEFLSPELLQTIGLIAVFLFGVAFVIFVFGLLFSLVIFKKKGFLEKLSTSIGSVIIKFTLFAIDAFYLPSKKIVSFFKGDERMIDTVNVEMRNMLMRTQFMHTAYEDRIVVLPQCLRSLECPAKFHSIEGARCMKCGKCKIIEITKKADELGYKGVYIAPGGSFVRRIIAKTKPLGVVGVGCEDEVNLGLVMLSDAGFAGQGVMLLRSGCVETAVDLEKLFNVMELSENGYGKNNSN